MGVKVVMVEVEVVVIMVGGRNGSIGSGDG